MGVFIVATIHSTNDARLKNLITSKFPSDHYEMGRGQWLVAFTGTAQELFSKLFPDTDTTGTVVFGIAGYFGQSVRPMWEWIATKLGGKLGQG